MKSEMMGTPKMIVPFEWILENVDEKPTTIASIMILFRGEQVFRVGLKNLAQWPILFFMAINLSHIGMKVEDVRYGIRDSGIGPATMTEMKKEDIGNEGSLQLFTITLEEKVLRNCTFVFRICIEGTDPGYSYQLCDRLAKDQIWAALTNEQNLADVELIVKDKTFFVHKAVLAAHSQVFADEFEKIPLVKDGSHRIKIDNVEPKTVEKFLHFIYTGESIRTLADEELLKLADRYGLTTLIILCQDALKKIDVVQMGNLMKRLNSNDEGISSSKIM
ncbi:hypothetical protein DAPPUDRAFT_226949 [Daphnia pulex]|uniref:BTB domain-containing protein n=1 Tax=Daphnia pulex TaxID=6669 RepID=E9H2M4_DAPPU|nr:hypothetical protein DAPPUDRAFT_226949 [Daphnia pulex]|eukprot:EFX74038.1 hypothetical protein DAPPUDRAFT_226949 [Daphnia pulex]